MGCDGAPLDAWSGPDEDVARGEAVATLLLGVLVLDAGYGYAENSKSVVCEALAVVVLPLLSCDVDDGVVVLLAGLPALEEDTLDVVSGA